MYPNADDAPRAAGGRQANALHRNNNPRKKKKSATPLGFYLAYLGPNSL